jgi:hypothetical protein
MAIAVPESTDSPGPRRPLVRHHARRVSVAMVGGATVAVGRVLIPLPGPGTLIVLAGLSILGREFPRARHAADKGKKLAGAAVDSARRGAGRVGDRFRR